MFGVCLQNATLGATPDLLKDLAGVPAHCEANNIDPWNAVPQTLQPLAHTTVAGATGRVDLVWGMRAMAPQSAGSYGAGIEFEVVALRHVNDVVPAPPKTVKPAVSDMKRIPMKRSIFAPKLFDNIYSSLEFI